MGTSVDAIRAAYPPGSSAPGIWQAFRFIVDPHGFVDDLRADYGDVFRIRTPDAFGVAILGPDLAKIVFAADSDAFEPLNLASDIFGRHSVIATSATTHRRQRKLLNPRFHGARVRSFYDVMQRLTREHLAPLADAPGRPVTMTTLTQALTLDIILETVFGADPDLDRTEGRRVLALNVDSVTPVVIGSMRLRQEWFTPWRRFVHARTAFDAWVDTIIAGRRQRGDSGDDLLGVMLDARYEDGTAMDASEIHDQLFTLLVAGHETTATAIAWGIYYLARQPATMRRLRDEVDRLGADPSAEAIVKSPYVSAVGSEALRIQPIVTDVVRRCRRDFQMGDHLIAAGDVISVLLCGILRDERLYPEPLAFKPERFLDRSFASFEMVPFGGGTRRCLGAAFAEAELSLALATIASEWNVTPATDQPEKAVRRNITMGPRDGVRVLFRRRDDVTRSGD